MKKQRSLTLFFVLVFLTASCITIIQPAKASADSWASKAPMHQARERLGVATVNGKIYAIGGDTLSGFWSYSMGLAGQVTGGVVGTNEQYDPITDTWTQKTQMPTPRDRFAIAACQNKIYCIGGATGENIYSGATATAVNEVYNPATDTWQVKAPFPTPDFPLQANVVNDKIYVLTYSGANYEYDPAKDSWTNKTQAPHYAFDGYVSAVVNNKIYVIGGLSSDQHYNLNQIYNPSTDTWSLGASPPTSIGNAVGEGAGGATTGLLALKQVYVLGQNGNLRQGEPPGTNRIYNPKNDSWTYGADVPTNRINFAVAVVNDTIYAIGGGSPDNLVVGTFSPKAVNEQYTPIGYGTPDPTNPAPTPSPIPTFQISVESPQNGSTTKLNATVNVSFNFELPSIIPWAGNTINPGTYAINGGSVDLFQGYIWAGVVVDYDRAKVVNSTSNMEDDALVKQSVNPVLSYSGDGTYSGNASLLLSEGTHTLVVWAKGFQSWLSYGADLWVAFSPTVTFNVGRPTGPTVVLLSPISNSTILNTSDVYFGFTVNESTSLVTYSLDGQSNVTFAGTSSNGVYYDGTLTGLSVGAHNLTVYAWNMSGYVGASETVPFYVADAATPTPSPSTSPTTTPTLSPSPSPNPSSTNPPPHSQPLPFSLIIIAAAVIVGVTIAGLAIYFATFRKKKTAN